MISHLRQFIAWPFSPGLNIDEFMVYLMRASPRLRSLLICGQGKRSLERAGSSATHALATGEHVCSDMRTMRLEVVDLTLIRTVLLRTPNLHSLSLLDCSDSEHASQDDIELPMLRQLRYYGQRCAPGLATVILRPNLGHLQRLHIIVQAIELGFKELGPVAELPRLTHLSLHNACGQCQQRRPGEESIEHASQICDCAAAIARFISICVSLRHITLDQAVAWVHMRAALEAVPRPLSSFGCRIYDGDDPEGVVDNLIIELLSRNHRAFRGLRYLALNPQSPIISDVCGLRRIKLTSQVDNLWIEVIDQVSARRESEAGRFE